MTEPESNGLEPHPPDGTITITLRLTPTPNGHALTVAFDPPELYPDVVIDACNRAVRAYERMQLVAELAEATKTRDRVRVFNQQTENLRRLDRRMS